MGLSVLYVEDDRVTARLNKMLASRDHPDTDIRGAVSFQEANQFLSEALAEGKPFDLIVSDFRFPGIDETSHTGGVDLYRLLAREMPHMPLIFLTDWSAAGHTIATQTERAVYLPVAIYSKSFSLSAVIEDWKEGKCPALRLSVAHDVPFSPAAVPAPDNQCGPRANLLARGIARLMRTYGAGPV